jgi:hypothetical protein
MEFFDSLGGLPVRKPVIRPPARDSTLYHVASFDGRLLDGDSEEATSCWLNVVAKPHIPDQRYEITREVIGPVVCAHKSTGSETLYLALAKLVCNR